MKNAHGEYGCYRVHMCTATALGRGRVASPTIGRLYPGESPRCSFYRRLSGSQDQSGHEGVKKNLHPSDTRGRTARRQASSRLSYLAHVLWNAQFVKCHLSFDFYFRATLGVKEVLQSSKNSTSIFWWFLIVHHSHSLKMYFRKNVCVSVCLTVADLRA